MAPTHKYAGASATITTKVEPGQIVGLSEKAAKRSESVDAMIRLDSSSPERLVYSIRNRVTGGRIHFMTFEVTVCNKGDDREITTSILKYRVTRTWVLVVPMPWRMVAWRDYRSFMFKLAEEVRAADPEATVRVSESVRGHGPAPSQGSASSLGGGGDNQDEGPPSSSISHHAHSAYRAFFSLALVTTIVLTIIKHTIIMIAFGVLAAALFAFFLTAGELGRAIQMSPARGRRQGSRSGASIRAAFGGPGISTTEALAQPLAAGGPSEARNAVGKAYMALYLLGAVAVAVGVSLLRVTRLSIYAGGAFRLSHPYATLGIIIGVLGAISGLAGWSAGTRRLRRSS